MPYFMVGKHKLEAGKIIFPLEENSGALYDKMTGGRSLYFMKAASSIATHGDPIIAPDGRDALSCSLHLAVALGKRCRSLKRGGVRDKILGLGLVLDVTDERMLRRLKAGSLPWDEAKSRDSFCPMSEFVSLDDLEDESSIHIYMERNGKEIVDREIKGVMEDIESSISDISKELTLYPGDIVAFLKVGDLGMVEVGDLLEGGASQIATMSHGVIVEGEK